MKLDVYITLNDYLRAAFYFRYSRSLMNGIRILALLIFIAVIYIMVAHSYMPRTRDLLILCFCFVYLFIFTPLFTYYRAKSVYRSIPNNDLPFTYVFTDSKIEVTNGENYSSVTWSDIYKVRESKSLFYLYQSKAIAGLLPKRYFTDQQIADFRKLVKQTGVRSELRKTLTHRR